MEGDAGLNAQSAQDDSARRRFQVHERSESDTRSDLKKAPETKALQPSENNPSQNAGAPGSKASQTRRPPIRLIMFALLPIALIAGAYWYVTGGRIISMDDAYVEADKVGVSTDVAGIVKEVLVTENQRVDAGQSSLQTSTILHSNMP